MNSFLKIFLLVFVCSCATCKQKTRSEDSSILWDENPVSLVWEELLFETKDVWNSEFEAYYSGPIFPIKFQLNEGRRVQIQGNVFWFEDYCFLADSAWNPNICMTSYFSNLQPPPQIELNFIDTTFEMTENVKVSGVLRLNTDNIYRLNLILDSAQIINN